MQLLRVGQDEANTGILNKSGWYILIPFYNFYLAVSEGTPGDNEYGPDPKSEGRMI